MKKRLLKILKESLARCNEQEVFETVELPYIEMEMTREEAHGDYASNVAMVIASTVKKNPRKIAEAIVGNIVDEENVLRRVEIAGPGFINFFVKENVWVTLLEEVDRLTDRYGESDFGSGRRVQCEFVSANPTGPLHIGHARGAVIGDVIASILSRSGFNVSREYYINDVGNQMRTLGRSVYLRYLELLGEQIEFPPEHYQGEYIVDLAREILEKTGNELQGGGEEVLGYFTAYASQSIMAGIKDDLAAFGVTFDVYFNESELYKDDGVGAVLAELKRREYIYAEEGTLWFKSTAFGDEKDRVVIRENGAPTYFAADIAYHRNKYQRGFDLVVDVWGADHHGYIPRMQASLQAMGFKKDSLKIVLVQLVSLLRHGKPVAMSTRAGEFVTMRQVIDEVGKDAARYNFLMRRSDSHLDFDLELAKRQSNENPVYYVQYGHARISSIMRLAAERELEIPCYAKVDLKLLKLPEEIFLIKSIISFPEVIEESTRTLEPHRLTFYLNDLAGAFHSYYNKNRVISDDVSLSRARLFLVKSVGQVMRNALSILGVSAPEKM
jgi:arginyl-tRNA synthetase